MPSNQATSPHTVYAGASRRARTAAVLIAAAALGLTGSVVTASAEPAPSHPTTHRSTKASVLHFGVEFSPQNVIDVPPRARHVGDYQAGDYAVFSDKLTHSDDVVGTEAGSGLVTKITKTQLQVYFTMAIKLHAGQIAAQGLSSNAPTKRLAITGGTGHYTGANGHLDLVENGDGTGTLTITLTR
jgi:hypothetical protein